MRAKENNALDLHDIFSILRRRKKLIILPLFLVTIFAYFGSFLIEPTYQSKSIIWIDKPSNVSSDLQRLLSNSNQRESQDEQRRRRQALETEIKSSLYISQLIRNLGLDNDPEISRKAAAKREKNPDVPLEEIKENLLIKKLSKTIYVSFQGMDHINIVCHAPSAALARDMANQLAEIFKAEKTRYETEKIMDNQSFTDAQLEKMEERYQTAIDSLNSARNRLSKLQLPENIASEDNRSSILSTIDKNELDKNDYDREVKNYRKQLRENNLTDLRLKYTDTIIELRTTIDGLTSDYSEMMERYSWNDQSVINVNIRLNDNIKLLEYSIQNTIKSQFSSFPEDQIEILSRYYIAQENYDILFSKKKKLDLTLERVDERMNKIPSLESEILELEGRVENYASLRDVVRSEEATVDILAEQMKNRTKYKIIESAKLALEPHSPDITKILFMGFALGLILAVGLVILTEILDKSYKKIEDIEDDLGLKVIATIPKIEKYNTVR